MKSNRAKFVSFRAPGQERFTRCKTLGEDYTEERITQRIKGMPSTEGRAEEQGKSPSDRLEDSIKAQQSAGYARWAKLSQLETGRQRLKLHHGTPD